MLDPDYIQILASSWSDHSLLSSTRRPKIDGPLDEAFVFPKCRQELKYRALDDLSWNGMTCLTQAILGQRQLLEHSDGCRDLLEVNNQPKNWFS